MLGSYLPRRLKSLLIWFRYWHLRFLHSGRPPVACVYCPGVIKFVLLVLAPSTSYLPFLPMGPYPLVGALLAAVFPRSRHDGAVGRLPEGAVAESKLGALDVWRAAMSPPIFHLLLMLLLLPHNCKNRSSLQTRAASFTPHERQESPAHILQLVNYVPVPVQLSTVGCIYTSFSHRHSTLS